MRKFLSTLCIACCSLLTQAQQNRTLTAADYAHAESRLNYTTEALIDNNAVSPNWLPNGRFWYRNLTATGSEFILVDPTRGTRSAAFDQRKLGAALSEATGKKYEAELLPFRSFQYSPDGNSISFQLGEESWSCDLRTYTCHKDSIAQNAPRRQGMNEIISPDGQKAALIRDYNIWIRNLKTGAETQLTTDGIKDFGYATDNAGWKSSDRPILLWSPDSRKIATYKQDQRNVSDMYLVTTNVGKPTLKSWKYPLPGDKDIIMIQRVIINVDTPKVIIMKMKPDPRRGTLCDDISCGGTGFDDVDWSDDATQLAFVSTSRDHKQEKFRIADPSTGEIREVFEETVPTQYESGRGAINWRYLEKSHEILWYSERDNWGHLYLYDANTGTLKNQITKGEWVVDKLLKVDEKNRLLYFTVTGRVPENPYFAQLYRIGFDGQHLTLLTPARGNHNITLSPSGEYFIDAYSTPDTPPVFELRKLDGRLITTLEKSDISRLVATGWKPPVPVTVKAHDGTTDLYGLVFLPTNLDTTQKYPIVNNIYPGPQGGSVGSWFFISARGDNQALADLGFVVVQIEGTSNPFRSKSYHDMSYGNMADNTLTDQITGMQQLAARYHFIDLDRVGIWGHSGGGFATAGAMFRYPDFFKVGIAESGNHDNRNYEDDWGERYDGLPAPVGTSDYDAQANENYARNLKGKLLLAHGLMDNNVPPYNTMLVVEALIKANKDFDLIVFPNSPHGYGSYSLYMMRRRWDYFVKNLQGSVPPVEYVLKSRQDPRNVNIPVQR